MATRAPQAAEKSIARHADVALGDESMVPLAIDRLHGPYKENVERVDAAYFLHLIREQVLHRCNDS